MSDAVFPFGKYAGTPLSQIPNYYLKWLFEPVFIDPETGEEQRLEINAELQRQLELEVQRRLAWEEEAATWQPGDWQQYIKKRLTGQPHFMPEIILELPEQLRETAEDLEYLGPFPDATAATEMLQEAFPPNTDFTAIRFIEILEDGQQINQANPFQETELGFTTGDQL